MPGILPRIRFRLDGDVLVLQLPTDFALLNGEHLRNRLSQFASFAEHADARVEVG